ncbi:glycosyltransferase [Microbacter margulisiae]|uniref:Glycosyltransferase involved in cell wall biosynthesis n=1 Tax=Microbacter margulisiae TaxID=1350067 RepID=A0A7W5DQG2_9PORP|nr:glycosyltransferase [Microbacter margulisiae]MBB3186699.1 glycosyltransferase involved in cell wall biosynthesis [Microbacter margulisiae]
MNKPLHIVQLPSYFMPFGGGEFCMEQSVALKKSGIDPVIIAHVILPFQAAFNIRYSPFEHMTEENGIPIYRTYQRNIPKTNKINLERWIKGTVNRVSAYIKKNGKPDLIHAHGWQCAGYACSIIKEKYQIPYIITEHSGKLNPNSDFIDKMKSDDWINHKIRTAYNHADAIIGVSNEVLDGIRQFLQTDVPLFCVSNLLDVDFFSLRQLKLTKHDNFIFAAANSNVPAKAYHILFQAFDILCEHNPNVQLHIAGNGFNTKLGKQLMRATIHHDKIELLGWQSPEGIRSLLYNADAFVLSSCEESQSIATLEAMCIGLPVVGTAVIPEVMLTSNVGYRVPVNDPPMLAKAMLKMIEHYQEFDIKKIRGTALALAHPDIVAKQILKIYQMVIA